MKKPDRVNNPPNNSPDENLLLAIVMGGIGFFAGFLIWFIMPATFGISATVYLLLSIILAAGFFAFGLLQPAKATHYLDQCVGFIVDLLRRVFKQDKKPN
ncbi:MAG: hypothetical protein PVG89_12035 [Gammaproteobacteria bacterium]|jgi:hypothetical protein